MSAASVGQPFRPEEPVTLTTIADEITERRPGYRVEIVALPDSVGAKVTPDVAEVLRVGESRRSD
jgi:hypothetical protein